jgi:hypothetical protein
MNWYIFQGVPMYITTQAASLMESEGVHATSMNGKDHVPLFTPKNPTFTDKDISQWLDGEKAIAEKAKIKKMKPDIKRLVRACM